jgi:hypothetical protein
MNLDPGDSVAESAQGILHHTGNVFPKLFAPCDGAICIDLDVHVLFVCPLPLGAG